MFSFLEEIMINTKKIFDKTIQEIAKVVKLINEDGEDVDSKIISDMNDDISDLHATLFDGSNDFVELKDLKNYIKDVVGKDYFSDKRCWEYLYDSVYEVFTDIPNEFDESMQTGLGMAQQLPTNVTYDGELDDLYNFDDEEEKKKMNKRLEEKKIDEEDRIEALAQFLGLDEEEKEDIEVDDETLTYDSEEYLVLTDSEADDWFERYQKDLWDDLGIQSFSESFQDWIINNALDKSWFEDTMDESNKFYCEDIANESSREFDNRLVEECYERGLIDDDDFEEDEDGDVDHEQCKKDNDDLIELMVEDMNNDYDDPVEWYKDNFGEEDLSKVAIENNLVDLDAVIEEVKNIDGRGCLATWNNVENEEKVNGEWFYIYRTN